MAPRNIPGTRLYVPDGMKTFSWSDLVDEGGRKVDARNVDLRNLANACGAQVTDLRNLKVDSFLSMAETLDKARSKALAGNVPEARNLYVRAQMFAESAADSHRLHIVGRYRVLGSNDFPLTILDKDGNGVVGKGELVQNDTAKEVLKRLGIDPKQLEGMSVADASLLIATCYEIHHGAEQGDLAYVRQMYEKGSADDPAKYKILLDSSVKSVVADAARTKLGEAERAFGQMDLDTPAWKMGRLADEMDAQRWALQEFGASDDISRANADVKRFRSFAAEKAMNMAVDLKYNEEGKYKSLMRQYGKHPILAEVADGVGDLGDKVLAAKDLIRFANDPRLKGELDGRLKEMGVRSVEQAFSNVDQAFGQVVMQFDVDNPGIYSMLSDLNEGAKAGQKVD